jgi:hypothetical protein
MVSAQVLHTVTLIVLDRIALAMDLAPDGYRRRVALRRGNLVDCASRPAEKSAKTSQSIKSIFDGQVTTRHRKSWEDKGGSFVARFDCCLLVTWCFLDVVQSARSLIEGPVQARGLTAIDVTYT